MSTFIPEPTSLSQLATNLQVLAVQTRNVQALSLRKQADAIEAGTAREATGNGERAALAATLADELKAAAHQARRGDTGFG